MLLLRLDISLASLSLMESARHDPLGNEGLLAPPASLTPQNRILLPCGTYAMQEPFHTCDMPPTGVSNVMVRKGVGYSEAAPRLAGSVCSYAALAHQHMGIWAL